MNNTKTQPDAASTFAQRFEFSRDRQRSLGTWREDAVLARHLGISASQITDYKARTEAPQSRRTLAIAAWCEVDPGWLAFGERTTAIPPEGFAKWLANTTATAQAPIIRKAPASKFKPAEVRATAKKRKAK